MNNWLSWVIYGAGSTLLLCAAVALGYALGWRNSVRSILKYMEELENDRG